MLLSFPLYLTDPTTEALPLLQPHVGKAMPTDWYPQMQRYFSHIKIQDQTHSSTFRAQVQQGISS